MKRLIATCVAAGVGVTVLAQEVRVPPYGRPPDAAPIQKPVFKSSVDLVTLDVTVLDGNRRPIRGLTPSDFTVLEDGSRQQIAVFNAVEIPDVEPPKTAWLRDVAPDVRTNDDSKERRLFLIIVDDATIEGDVYAMKQLRDQTKNIINRLNPSDLASIIFTMDNRKSLDFTSDRARLLKAVESQPMGFYGMEGSPELKFTNAWFEQASVDTLRRAVETLATLTDRRRAIVYVGAGVPVDLGLGAEPASLGLGGGASVASQSGAMGDLAHRMGSMFQAASRGNISVNTIDVCGLRLPPGGVGSKSTCVDGLQSQYLRNVAVATGGRAVVNTNDFDPGVSAIFVENSSYYLLGYQSSNPSLDGKFRRIEVRVNKPGLTILTRSGYVPEKPDDAARRKLQLASQPLGAAMSGILPKGDLPMRLTAVPFAIPGKKESSVFVMLGVTQPIRDTGARTVEHVDLQVRAYTTDGKSVGAANLRADVTVRPGATGLAEYEVLAELPLKPGRYQLRTAANVGALATSGSLYYDIDVPSFADAGVSLSGLVLTASPALPSGGLKPVLPVKPTTQRRFDPTVQASAFFRVYTGGRRPPVEVPLRIRVRNADDLTVLDRRETIGGPTLAAQRFANVNISLPIGRLPKGEYLLTVETTTGKDDVTRTLRFEVDR